MSKSAKLTSTPRRSWAVAVSALLVSMSVTAPILAEAETALPPGPAENLRLWAGEDAEALKGVLGRQLSAEQWTLEFSGLIESDALPALADYLALNAPVETLVDGDVSAVLAALPLDGKQLFFNNCLSCHGGDRYFLQQSKTGEEWIGIFDAPYHRRLLTEGLERETFATYAAATTPLVLDSVPDALRDSRE